MPIFEISPRLSIHYLEHNPSGNPTVLLLHGLGATGDSWLLQFPPLTEAGYHVLGPDVRGFGKSTSKPTHPVTVLRCELSLDSIN